MKFRALVFCSYWVIAYTAGFFTAVFMSIAEVLIVSSVYFAIFYGMYKFLNWYFKMVFKKRVNG